MTQNFEVKYLYLMGLVSYLLKTIPNSFKNIVADIENIQDQFLSH